MKKLLMFFLTVFPFALAMAQGNQSFDTAWKHEYRGTYPIINNLVHTKVDLKFDFPKAQAYGKVWLTLKPHFYPTDSLTLDAKYMDIKEVSVVKGNSKTKLKYSYDSLQLHIDLDKTYKKDEAYTVYIDYVSRPEQVKSEGSSAITEAKGLYFINGDGKGKYMTQLWTQGESEANSTWVPIIDKPNQKTTQEISMTVPSDMVTLSNGLLTTQKKNPDGTRTDVWKMDRPNAPYLFFMGAGNFAIIKDKYKNIPVNYYVEKEYAPLARKIFGETPKMIEFFSRLLNYPYPWNKYDQMVGREYVSGAMENTTATLHQDGAYQNARQLVDGNRWESVISHELFHHWFGDLVTTESWSNITVNESFANYSEYLWNEYRHGKDYADDKGFEDMQGYLASNSSDKDLVRFYYRDKEDVFDAVSYNKGGRILHMLRNFVGDDAFFASLNKYLTDNKYKSAEAQQLRLAFETVTGKDMNWFWNEWYYGSGEPHLDISYNYANGNQIVYVKQLQKGQIFKVPVYIDIYSAGGEKTRHKVWLQNPSDSFYFPSAQKPAWVNVDADKVLLAVKEDHKTLDAYELQYKYGGNYLDRREALEFFAAKNSSDLVQGLNDKYAGLRLLTLQLLQSTDLAAVPSTLSIIEQIASKDPDKKTQAMAMQILATTKAPQYQSIYEKFLNDSSYSVAGAALEGYAALHPDKAYQLAKSFSKDAKDALGQAVSEILFGFGKESDFDMLFEMFHELPLGNEKITASMRFAHYLVSLKDADKVKKGADELLKVRTGVPEQYRSFIDPAFKRAFAAIADAQAKEGHSEAADYIRNLMK